MELISCEKNLTSNITSLSNDYFYVINKNNGLIYYSTTKGISLEFIVDLNFHKDNKGIFIYEEFGGSDVISIIYINSLDKTVEFKISSSDSNNFHLKKVENFIKAICVQNNINKIYYFENSQVANDIKLPEFIQVDYISRIDFKKSIKKNGKLKNNRNKIIFLVIFCAVTIVIEFTTNKSFEWLMQKSRDTYNKNYTELENKKNNLLIEINKFESLSQDLKDIKLFYSKEDYLNFKRQEQPILINEEIVQ